MSVDQQTFLKSLAVLGNPLPERISTPSIRGEDYNMGGKLYARTLTYGGSVGGSVTTFQVSLELIQ
jgi:hypothetical protein